MATDYTPNVDDIAAPTSGHPPYRVFDEIRLLKERAKVLWGMRGQTRSVTYEVKAAEFIPAGAAVTLNGSLSSADEIRVSKASPAAVAIGVAFKSIASGEIGYILEVGVIEGLDTSAFTKGSVLYTGINGTLTDIEPTTGYAQPVAFVLKSQVNNGAILVNVNYPKQDAADVRVTNTSSLPFTTVQQALQTIQDTLLSEIDSRAAADSSLQSQIGGQAPLTSSAFSPISWHAQVIENSVDIPDNVNAWSFGPTMELSEGQVVTVGTGSTWTINH